MQFRNLTNIDEVKVTLHNGVQLKSYLTRI